MHKILLVEEFFYLPSIFCYNLCWVLDVDFFIYSVVHFPFQVGVSLHAATKTMSYMYRTFNISYISDLICDDKVIAKGTSWYWNFLSFLDKCFQALGFSQHVGFVKPSVMAAVTTQC